MFSFQTIFPILYYKNKCNQTYFRNFLENLNFFILGGDLYKKNNNKFEHTYDNWYYEGNIQSDSIIKTREYLDNFKNNQNLYVSFVFK